MNLIRKFNSFSLEVKSSIVYVISSVVSKGLAVITLPLFTRLMPTEQIGVVGIFNSWVCILGPIASLALITGGFNVAMKEFRTERDSYCSSILTLTILSSTFFLISFFVFPDIWLYFVKLPYELVFLALFGLFVQPGYDIYLAKCRYEYNYKSVFLLTVLLAVVSSLFSVVSIIVANKFNYEELGSVRLYANYSLIYIVDCYICVKLFVKGKKTYSKAFWLFSLKLSLPLIINSLSAVVLGVSDRLMISQMGSNSDVGIYTTIYSLGSLPVFVWSAINMAYIPFLFERIDNTSEHNKIHKSSNSFLLFFGSIVITVSLFSPELIKIFATNDYIDAVEIVPVIALAIFYIAIANMYSNILLYYKKTNLIMICTVVAALLNILLNLLLIPYYGYKAAAYTTLFSYVVMAILQKKLAEKQIINAGFSNSIYDERAILLIQMLVFIVCTTSSFMSGLPEIRYSIILVTLSALILKRKRVFEIINSVSRR